MKRGINVGKEQFFIAGIGFFVGRAVCFNMNPLAAAFWAAANVEGMAGIWLYLAMTLGMISRLGISGAISFTIYCFLVVISVHAYVGRKQAGINEKEKETSLSKKEKDSENKEKAEQEKTEYIMTSGDWARLCILGGISLCATQLFVWTIFGGTVNAGTLFSNGEIKYLWSNQKNSILALLQAGLEGMLTACLGYLLLAGLSKKERQLIRAGGDSRKGFLAGCLLVAIVLYGLPSGLYSTFAIAESVCYLVILWVAYAFGVLESTTAAALCGAVLAYQLNDFSVLGLVTLLGAAAGLMREMGRIGIFSGMALAALVIYLGVPETSLATNSLKGLVTSGVIFLFMPRSFLMQKTVEEESTLDLVQEQLGRTVRERVRDFSGGFFQLQNELLKLPKPQEVFSDREISTMYLQMKENVCDQCESRYRCYNVDAKQTFLAAKSIFQALDEKGGICKEDIPEAFCEVCDNQEAFMIGANMSFERAKSNRIIQQKLTESREALARQIGDVALLMNEFSSELVQDCTRDEQHELLLRLKLHAHQVEVRQVLWWKREEEPDNLYVVAKCHAGTLMTAREMATHLSQIYGFAYRPADSCRAVITKNYEVYSFVEDTAYYMLKGVRRIPYKGHISGDNFSFLELSSGEFVAMLSDGMGTGEEAYTQSAMLIELLEEFLEAGFEKSMALSLANSVLTLNVTSSSFTTLDLVSVNLYNGLCQLVKIGAAATFIKRKEQVETIVSTSLPAGVFSVMDYELTEYALQEGDMVILVSDGVMDAIVVEEKETYMKEMIGQLTTINPQKAADVLLEKIKEMAPNRVKDDMTVMVFSLWKKK